MNIVTSKTHLRLLQLRNGISSDSKPFYLVRTILCSDAHEMHSTVLINYLLSSHFHLFSV